VDQVAGLNIFMKDQRALAPVSGEQFQCQPDAVEAQIEDARPLEEQRNRFVGFGAELRD
jgi:hypothetical protein